ncbi:hypothetical protein [Paenibacillus sp. IHBB 3054]|uniref:hypothetical protein n=1 Tax=Paenibacillus sp. IHBB 3054 TaxID=3425689 RepID=UPI003F666CF3
MAQNLPSSLDELNAESYIAIEVPANTNKMLSFSINADINQAIGIYGPEKFKYAERFSNANFDNLVLHGFNDIFATYYIAGFAFHPTPIPEGKWHQSKVREHEQGVKIGFDDFVEDGDFDDLVVDITGVTSS